MKIIQRTDAQASGNAWVLSLVQHTGLSLDGQTLTLRIVSNIQHAIYLKLIKVLYAGQIQALNPAKMSNVKVEMVDDPQAPDDLVIRVDWTNYSGPGGGVGGMLGMLGLTRSSPNLGDLTFHDWHSTKTELAWVQSALEVRLYFENKPDPQLTYNVCGTGIHIHDLVFTIQLIPYVFWSAEIEPHLDRKGLPANGYWLSGKDIYKHRCAMALGMSYSDISPGQAADGADTALNSLQESIGESLPQDQLFRYIEALFIKDNDFGSLIGGSASASRLRGVDITPGLARFLYFDEEDDAPSFVGHGQIVAVRKDRINASLLPPSELPDGVIGSEVGWVHDYPPDNIIEVEVQRNDGKLIRISTLNLVRSILEGKAKIDGVHVVLRDRIWGEVCSKLNQPGGTWCSLELYYNGYLRSNHGAGLANNLDNLPKYDYDRNDPLYRNLYDGTFYFVQADLLPNGLKRFLYHRAWDLNARFPILLNGYMILNDYSLPDPFRIILAK